MKSLLARCLIDPALNQCYTLCTVGESSDSEPSRLEALPVWLSFVFFAVALFSAHTDSDKTLPGDANQRERLCIHDRASIGRVEHWAYNGWVLLSDSGYWLDYDLKGEWVLADLDTRKDLFEPGRGNIYTNFVFGSNYTVMADGKEMEYAIWISTWTWSPVLILGWGVSEGNDPYGWPPDPDLGIQEGVITAKQAAHRTGPLESFKIGDNEYVRVEQEPAQAE